MKAFIFSMLFFLPLQTWANDCNGFGSGISLLNTQKTVKGVGNIQGDYNGDGVIDRVVFLRLDSKPEFAMGVKVINLFEEKPTYPKSGSVAIGIILMGGEGACEKYVIYNDFFFNPGETSIWGGLDGLPIGLIKKNSKGFRLWRKQIRELKSDALQLGSESGMNILLYWNGETFTAQWDKYANEP